MNIKSVMDLSEQLKNLGFSDLLHLLVKRICFKPKRFVIGHQVEKGGNILRCQLSFESDDKALSGYTLSYYDAFFQPAQLYNGIIGGVDVVLLAKMMSEIDWIGAFDFTWERDSVSPEKRTFENELKVAAVVDNLLALQSSLEGKEMAINLKQKYWFGIAVQDSNFLNETASKQRLEVNQRFYVIDGQPSISVDEAYRYLQNRWLEKEMLARRKQTDSSSDENTEATGFGTGLLKKRRRRKLVTSNGRK